MTLKNLIKAIQLYLSTNLTMKQCIKIWNKEQ